MGRHVTGRLRGPRWTRVRAQSFPRSYFMVLGGFCTITSTYKGLCGDSCWPDRAGLIYFKHIRSGGGGGGGDFIYKITVPFGFERDRERPRTSENQAILHKEL